MPLHCFRLIAYFHLLSAAAAAQSVITTYAGSDWIFNGDALPAIDAPLGELAGVAPGPDGSFYFVDRGNRMVMQVDAQGTLRVIAGNGVEGQPVMAAPSAKNALFPANLIAVTGDGIGGLYVTTNSTVLQIKPNGRVSTVAGGGEQHPGDGGRAINARLNVSGIAVDAAGNLFIADYWSHRVRKVTPDGVITTIAGTGTENTSGDGGPASQASVARPNALAFDAAGNLYIGAGGTVRKVSVNGTISTAVTSREGIYITAILFEPSGAMVLGTYGGLYRVNDSGVPVPLGTDPVQGAAAGLDGSIVFSDVRQNRLLKMPPNGQVGTFAGNGKFRFAPEGTPAIGSYLFRPVGVALNPQGDLFVGDSNNFRVLKITPDGHTSTFMQLPRFLRPQALVLDGAGGVYVSDGGTLYYVPLGGTPRLFAATGSSRIPLLGGIGGLALDTGGNLYIADTYGHRIFKLPPIGIAQVIAGTGTPGFAGGDNSPAIQAQLNGPHGLALDAAGNLYVAEEYSNRIRRITPDGLISTVAGTTPVPGFSGDGGLPAAARLYGPQMLAFDGLGRLLVSDTGNHRIRRITFGQTIETLAGNGTASFTGDGGSPLNATINSPSGVAADAKGNIYFADSNNDRIRVVRSSAVTFDLSATSLAFEAPEFAPSEIRLNSSVSGLAFSATVAAAPWLSVSPSSGTLPVSLRIAVSPANLAPGRYNGTITVSVPLAVPSSRQIVVTLTVPTVEAPKLSVGSQSVSFQSQLGKDPASIGLSLSNQGGRALSFSATVSTSTGGGWLTVSPSAGTIEAKANTTVNLTARPSGLAEGTYSATLNISDGANTTRLPVTLSIGRSQGKLLLSQTGLTFTAVEGGGSPSPQTFGVLNEGSGELPFDSQATTLSGGSWLKLKSASGRVIRPLQDVSFIEVVPDSRDLIEGDHYAEIRVMSPGISPQIVTVLIKVLPRGSNPGPEVRPTGLVFIGTPGTVPPSEDVRVSNILGVPTTYTSSSLTFDGGKWISHLPAVATINPNEPRRIVVQPNFTGIAAGIKRGALYLLFEDGSSRAVNILSIVPAAGASTNKDGIRQAVACASPTLRSEFLSMPEGFNVTIGQPATIDVKVADECGNLLVGNEKNTHSAVFSKFSNGDPDLRMVPIGNGVWSGTWRPVNASLSAVTVSAVSVFVQGLTVQAGRSDRSVRLSTGSRPPIVTQGSLVQSASQKGGAPVAPGTLVSIYGANLANSTDTTQVFLGGAPLPLLFTSATQINAQVSYDLEVNTEHQVVVRRGAALSVPESFTVASTQPGIFTINQQGTGQGVVIGPDQVTIADSNNPANRGLAIVIYCTGLGAVTPNSLAGQPAPASPLATTTSSVNVFVGDKIAQVFFAGLTPGFAGLYQVNAVLAPDTPTGDSVPLSIYTSGQTSNIVTIAVR